MPIEVGIWKLGQTPERVQFLPMPSEERLEQIIADDISILDPGLLLIGRQVATNTGAIIDLLAIDVDGKLSVIELKRHQTPKGEVAQLLDYGSWVRNLQHEDIASIFEAFLGKYKSAEFGTSLDDAFKKHFGVTEIPASLNEGHELVIVASELDDSAERIVRYLSDEYGVAINAICLRFFKEGDAEFLSRVWLIVRNGVPHYVNAADEELSSCIAR